MAERRRLLILGGTGEAVALAEKAAALSNLDVITSLAGRTRHPVQPKGTVRVGGFGGAGGLARYLDEAKIDVVIDATHPFAAQITRHAAEACAWARRPLLVLVRPAWEPQAGDIWVEVGDVQAAASAAAARGRRVFLTIGRQELAPFVACADHWFLIRVVEPPAAGLPFRHYALVTGRGPFTREGESALLERHRIDVLVSKNSGGPSTYAKIAAARSCRLPVVMIRRPPLPPGEHASDVATAVAWIAGHLA